MVAFSTSRSYYRRRFLDSAWLGARCHHRVGHDRHL